MIIVYLGCKPLDTFADFYSLGIISSTGHIFPFNLVLCAVCKERSLGRRIIVQKVFGLLEELPHILVSFDHLAVYEQLFHTVAYSILKMVGVVGFELTTLCSQSRCANQTALHPDKNLFYTRFLTFVKLVWFSKSISVASVMTAKHCPTVWRKHSHRLPIFCNNIINHH